MLESIQLTLVDADRKNKTATFEPTKFANFAFHNRQTIKLTIIDGKEDLFFKALLLTHTVKLYSDNATVTVRFTLDCSMRFSCKYLNGVANDIIEIEPAFGDIELFNASQLIRVNVNGKVERQLSFTCSVDTSNSIDEHVSDR